MSATQNLPLYQSNGSPDWALIENIDARQLSETHLATGEPASACKLSRGSSSLGTDNGALSVAAGSVVVNGEAHDIADQPVDIPYGDNEPRRDVVYVDGDGNVQVRLGQPGPLVWDDGLSPTSQTLKNAYRPAPPDLVSTSGYILGVVTVEANAASLPTRDCIHDLRIGAPVATPAKGSLDRPYTELSADMAEDEVRSIINGAGDGATFWIEPGSSWRVAGTLTFPDGCRVFGNTPMRGAGSPTFIKDFDGPLASVGAYSTFHNVDFHGKKVNYTGNVVEGGSGRTTRNTTFYQCNFRNGAGDGYHAPDNYFMTWMGCLIQDNEGWGVWFGVGENPHNQMLGPCYIGGNGAGGIYQASYGRNQQFYSYIGNNGGPGIQFDDPGNRGGFVGFAFRGALVNNNGPAYLVTGGSQRNHRILDTQIANNAAAPDAGLTTPVGQIHVEGGSLGLELSGGQGYGHGQLINTAAAPAAVVVDSPSDVFKGNVDGSSLAFERRGETVVDGTISVKRSGPLSRIHLSSNQSIPNETFTKVDFDASTDDALGGADTANGQITLPADGSYSVLANIRAVGVPDGSRIIARIDVDGVELARADSHSAVSGGDALTARVSDGRGLDGGRNVTALAWQDTGSALDLRAVESETFLVVTGDN